MPAENELFLIMVARKMSMTRIAARFNVTVEEACFHAQALEELSKTLEASAAAQAASTGLPSAQEVAEAKKHANPLVSAFIDLCQRYDALGEGLRAVGEQAGAHLGIDEIEQVVQDCLREPRQMQEPIQRKLARALHARVIVIPIAKTDAKAT
jgi:hypothetical protein